MGVSALESDDELSSVEVPGATEELLSTEEPAFEVELSPPQDVIIPTLALNIKHIVKAISLFFFIVRSPYLYSSNL
jgi:hypothetical protein